MTPARSVGQRLFDLGAMAALYAVLVWAPVAGGAHQGWPLAVTQLLVLSGLMLWVSRMAWLRRLEWRRTALDLPLALLVATVLAQLVLGNGPLVRWSLAPGAFDPLMPPALPTMLVLGTVSPAQTARSLRLFLTYAATFALVVNVIRTRRDLDRLVRTLLTLGAVLSFLGLLDYLVGEAWLLGAGAAAERHRLSATFVNPDHFAAWLEMLICLGIGYMLARSRASEDDAVPGAARRSHETLERLARRYLPMIGIGVMALALIFTLSRGGLVSLALALMALLALQGLRGRARPSLVLVGSVLAVTVGFSAWIGLGPLLARLASDQRGSRLTQLFSTLEMIRTFPVFGVGLGAYRDIFFRYQPAALQPGTLYFPYAHNDLLQLAAETGLIGTAISLWAGWRAGRDLLGAHVLGRGRCPVGGGEDEGARRSDGWSVGLGLGAIAGVLALLAHSAFDFGARIPANGLLAAACLGVATVALHTRFTGATERWLGATCALRLGGSALVPVLTGLAAVVAALLCVPSIVRAPLVEARLEGSGPAASRVEAALALAPRDPEARWARARLRLALARQIWDSGQTSDGRLLTSWGDRRREALAVLPGAVGDLETAIAMRPSDPFLHEALAWAHGHAAAIDRADPRAHEAAALTALGRAIALQPENPYLYRSLAALSLSQREPRVPLALAAARRAIEREPSLLPGIAEWFLPLRLTDGQWAEMVPDRVADRLELGALLERVGLASAAEAEYRPAAVRTSPGTAAFARWALARSLLRRGNSAAALRELDDALAIEPDNPELHLLRARALAPSHDVRALDAYRAALASAQARAARGGTSARPFLVDDARVEAVVGAALGPGDPGVPRYRRALAEFLGERALWDQAAREWERVIADAPRDAGAHHGRATALGMIGQRAEALEEHRRAVELDSRSVPFRMDLARGLWESDQFYQAMNEWRAVLGQEPGNVDARMALATGLLKTGDRSAALRELERVLLLAPGSQEARRELAKIGRGRGD
jgi:tetratricopeptide (TPR) repeat protein/O-antigen ligase